MSRPRILIADDEKNILLTLSRALKVEGFSVEVAGSGKLALERASQQSFDLVLLDVRMPDIDGLDVLRTLVREQPELKVVVMSGHGTIETAVTATRLGAYDYLEKPISTDRLLVTLGRALESAALSRENRELREQGGAGLELIGASPAMARLREQIELAGSASAPVLVTGERGTGKELVARALHAASSRSGGPLEKLNCAAVPSELVESELFGHEAGAFTGATRQRRGKFERAHQGTLFLDEIGDMPRTMQAKLLRVLQEGEIERVGGGEALRIDVRLISATNRDLAVAIEEKEFRADLFDRINVVPIRVPPLRERREDIPELVRVFLARASRANDRREKELSGGALALLCQYDFPGNVRELKNLVERLVILARSDVIGEPEARALLPVLSPAGAQLDYDPKKTLRELVDDAERTLIRKALDHHEGNVTRAADALGLERSHLYKKMRALGLR